MTSRDFRRIFIVLILVRIIFFREGFLTNDEPAHYLLSRSIAENFPNFINLSEYVKSEVGKGAYYSFFIRNGEVHAAVDMGYPLLASPFYLFAGKLGVHLFNLIADLLVCYAVYLFASTLFNCKTGILAAIIYTFATPSVFYSSSTWHHTSTALFFILMQYFLIKGETRKNTVLFSLSAALTVMCTYYMIVPVSFLVFYGFLTHKENRLLLIFSLTIFLLPVFWYNYMNFGNPLLGEYGIPAPVKAVIAGEEHSYSSDAMRVLKGLFEEVISVDIAPHSYSFAQKAILQSSPFLVFGLIYGFIRRNSEFRAIFVANLLLILMVAYYDGDFGGWELNMRYAFPTMPFFAVSSAGLLWHLNIELPAAILTFLLVIMSAFQLFYPISPYTGIYVFIKIFSTFLTFMALFIVFTKNRRIIQIGAVILLFFSAFVNINDASYGASYRAIDSFITKSIYPVEDVVLLPEGKFNKILIEDARVLFYNKKNLGNFLYGNITVIINKNSKISSHCKILTIRKFNKYYKRLIFYRYHKNLARNLSREYIILDLAC